MPSCAGRGTEHHRLRRLRHRPPYPRHGHRAVLDPPHCRAEGTYEAFAHAYLAGYRSVRPLPDRFDELLEPYLLLRNTFILNFVTAAAPVNAEVAKREPRRIAGIVANMQAYLAGQPDPGNAEQKLTTGDRAAMTSRLIGRVTTERISWW